MVLGSRKTKTALLKSPQARNWTSFIECISATGKFLNPAIIFKGKSLQKQWFIEEFRKIADWHYIFSDNGWTSNEIVPKWLQEVFIPETKPKNEGDARLLILDGHGSHTSVGFFPYFFKITLTLKSGGLYNYILP